MCKKSASNAHNALNCSNLFFEQEAVHLVMDVLVFWILVFKFWLLSDALIYCNLNNDFCIPTYKSFQVI